jgi:alpha-tubulin suppressor-like RCC1 family protein
MHRGSGNGRVRRVIMAVWLAGGVLSGVSCRGTDIAEPTVPSTASELQPALATTTSALAFRQVSAGSGHTCGVTTDDRAYCWGHNRYGQLGDGTTTRRLRPVAVASTLRFRRVTAGTIHACGLTTGDRVYCWGRNAHGQLGNGTFRDRLKPVAVAGGLQFRDVSAGGFHTCGVTLNDRAYCWGRNDQGRLGDGTADIERPEPVPVTGGLRFRQVGAGEDHTCGVTTGNRVYCWGNNDFGQLGSGGTSISLTPVQVASLRSFSRVSAGWAYNCAVTSDNRAFCWGDGRSGQIGDGKSYLRYTPRAVTGGLLFRGVSAGSRHTCGVTTDDRAYCWGYNGFGQLGEGGTTLFSKSPIAVAGGHQVRQVDAGSYHTCSVTTNGRAYCWGVNYTGELGDGTTIWRTEPVPVADPM